MELLTYFQNRRSVRSYTGEPIPKEALAQILQAGMLSASGKALRPWEFIIVRDRSMLDALAGCRVGAAQMLCKASCAIVVLGDETRSDVWIEDCAVAMANMHLMADGLGLGSCWIQGRLRGSPDGRSTEAFVRELIRFPDHLRLAAILSLGIPVQHPEPRRPEDLPMGKLHWETY